MRYLEKRQGMKSYDIRYRGGRRLRRENCVHEASYDVFGLEL